MLYNIVNITVFILQTFILSICIKCLKKNIIDFGSIFYIIYYMFNVPIYIDYFYELNFFKYTYKIVSGYNIDAYSQTAINFNIMSFLIMVMFFIGYRLYKKNNNHKALKNMNSRLYSAIQIFLLIIWIVLTTISINKYGKGIFLYFTPAVKNIYSSFYEKYLVISIPYIMFTLRCCRDLYKYKKIKKSILFYEILLLLSTLPTGQRREIISAIIYISLVLIFFNQNIKQIITNSKEKIHNKKSRKKIVLLGIISLLLISITWYGRVLFTQIQNGKTNIVKPWENRSIIEVIYGSSSTCFPTTIAINNYYKNTNDTPYLKQLKFLITSFIPSSIYSNKQKTFIEELQLLTNNDSNLSLFYINDMYFTYGYISIVISLLFGYLIGSLYKNNSESTELVNKYISLLMFSQIILLYKNGAADYIIRISFVVILSQLCVKAVFKKEGELNGK